ncbi:MAG TPA: hypothetical protein VE244_09850 [Nitrososphaeraceae archaeon]|nr:hypothetical protein [Nitrososphaeraceae archaeon]
MESINLQLELKQDSISVRANLLQGVLVDKTFEGQDCYVEMLSFIKQAYPNDQYLTAAIVLK